MERFLRHASELEVALVCARVLPAPGIPVTPDEPVTIGQDLVLQFLHNDVVYTWSGSAHYLPDGDTGDGPHPSGPQQEVIDRLVGQLVNDPDYRRQHRKTSRDSYARTTLSDLADAARGTHPSLPARLVWRVLQSAHDQVEHDARQTYADADLSDFAEQLDTDRDFRALYDKTVRRQYVRDALFTETGHAPTPALVSQILDETTPPARR